MVNEEGIPGAICTLNEFVEAIGLPLTVSSKRSESPVQIDRLAVCTSEIDCA